MPWVVVPSPAKDQGEDMLGDEINTWIHTNRIVSVRTGAFYEWKQDPNHPDDPKARVGKPMDWNVVSVTLDSGLEIEVEDLGEGELLSRILGLPVATLREIATAKPS